MADFKTLRQQDRLRKRAIEARQKLTAYERDIASEKIADAVIRSTWFQRSQNVACYLSTQFEVDTWRIIARAWTMKKRVFAPVCGKNHKIRFREVTSNSDLDKDRHGILVPRNGKTIDPGRLDLVITPLVAFDGDNNRIGMGGGYFDRTFSFLKHREHLYHPKLIGVAFACQKIDEIASNPWDVPLFTVVSDS